MARHTASSHYCLIVLFLRGSVFELFLHIKLSSPVNNKCSCRMLCCTCCPQHHSEFGREALRTDWNGSLGGSLLPRNTKLTLLLQINDTHLRRLRIFSSHKDGFNGFLFRQQRDKNSGEWQKLPVNHMTLEQLMIVTWGQDNKRNTEAEGVYQHDQLTDLSIKLHLQRSKSLWRKSLLYDAVTIINRLTPGARWKNTVFHFSQVEEVLRSFT